MDGRVGRWGVGWRLGGAKREVDLFPYTKYTVLVGSNSVFAGLGETERERERLFINPPLPPLPCSVLF